MARLRITEIAARRTITSLADLNWFWDVIDATIDDDEANQLAKLTSRLRPLPDQDLVDFISLFNSTHNALNSWRLWAAAYLINGGASDDEFHYFRTWLISRGRRITELAVADPDTLSAIELKPDAASFEEFAYVMFYEFKSRANGKFPRIPGEGSGNDIADPDWDFDFDDAAQMSSRLPRLARQFLA